MLLPLAARIQPSPIALLHADEIAHPERALARGELTRVRRGVYAHAPEWRGLAPWERYLARVHGVALVRPDAVFSHESAAALLGMPIFGDPAEVHVLDPATGQSRSVSGVHVHTHASSSGIVAAEGMLLTDHVTTAVTLARHRHPAIGLAAADSALRADLTATVEMLVAENERRPSSRGRAVARWALRFADPLAETALESISRAVVHWLGFPAPELQVRFLRRGGVEDRADFWWESQGIVGEADGDLKFDGRFGDPLEVVRRRRERDTRLLSGRVRVVEHWTWPDAVSYVPLGARLRSAGLRPERPENTAVMHSLRRQLERPPGASRRRDVF